MNNGLFGGFGNAQSMGKPLRVTRLTSGSGIFYPLGGFARVTLVGAGGAGRNSGGFTGGGAGATNTYWTYLEAPQPYIVGAPGLGNAQNGSPTGFGPLRAQGGDGTGGVGGVHSNSPTPSSGASGGQGGYTSYPEGSSPGYMYPVGGGGIGVGGVTAGGGSSVFGRGGDGATVGLPGNGYGAGGGIGASGVGAGSGGLIIVEEF